jgi:hypothetical protein
MTAFCLGLLLGTPKLGDPSAEIEPADAALTPVLTARAEA